MRRWMFSPRTVLGTPARRTNVFHVPPGPGLDAPIWDGLVPVHYQEPFRRDFSEGWQPEVSDFVADLRGAIDGGAAGWCFHNGDNRWGADSQPRRSFDLRAEAALRTVDPVEQQTVKQLAAAVTGREK